MYNVLTNRIRPLKSTAGLIRSVAIHYVVVKLLKVKDLTHSWSDELLDSPRVSITREDIPVTMVMGTKCLCNFNRYGC